MAALTKVGGELTHTSYFIQTQLKDWLIDYETPYVLPTHAM
jgi:hypothetical protein